MNRNENIHDKNHPACCTREYTAGWLGSDGGEIESAGRLNAWRDRYMQQSFGNPLLFTYQVAVLVSEIPLFDFKLYISTVSLLRNDCD